MASAAAQQTSPHTHSGEGSNGSELVEEESHLREHTDTPPFPFSDRIQDYLALMPTKKDIESMFKKLEDSHKLDMVELREGLAAFHQRIGETEAVLTSHSPVIKHLQKVVEQQQEQITVLCKQQDDLEDQLRRNNIRLQGIPETIATEDLRPTVLGILNTLLGRQSMESLELD